MRLIARGLAAGRLQTLASGLAHIPAEGAALIVARHYHHLYDGLAFFAALPRPFHIVVTLDWAKSQPTKYSFEALAGLARWPVLLRGEAVARAAKDERSLFSQHDVGRYQRKALRQAVDLLVAGRIVVIFPEGYPNIDPHYTPKNCSDEFLPFKPGFVNIAAAAEKRSKLRVPIIPAGLRYAQGKPWIAHLDFGRALYRENFTGNRELIVSLEMTVRKLSGLDSGPAGYQAKAR